MRAGGEANGSPYPWAEGRPNLHVLDNIDPERLRSTLERLEPKRAHHR